MKRILYVHGLGGGANGRVPTLLREHLGEEYIIDAPEIPIKPEEAMDFIARQIQENDYDLAVGSSLGAFYLMKVGFDLKKLLINPAVEAGSYIEEFIGYGEQEFRSLRADGSKTYLIDEDFIKTLKSMEKDHDDEKECYFMCYVSPEDDLFGPENAKNCRKYFLLDNIVLTRGDHSTPDEIVVNTVIPGIKEFIND